MCWGGVCCNKLGSVSGWVLKAFATSIFIELGINIKYYSFGGKWGELLNIVFVDIIYSFCFNKIDILILHPFEKFF
jgi:hypothetical protein